MNIRAYEALSRQGEDWTEAFEAAIRALRSQGGGTLLVPPGLYKAGSLQLYSDMTLRLEAGAVLRFHDDPARFPLIDTEFEGTPGKAYRPCVFARDASNVRVEGQGTLDGNGARWWRAFRARELPHARPYLVCFERCERVAVEGVRLVNSPVWTIHPMYCRNVSIRGVTIENPADSPNTDGINPNGCSFVRISDCHIDVGDDCVAIKSGTEDTPSPRPCENIVITGCTMARGHGGVVIGSEMSGGVRNVIISGCVFQNTERGIRLKTRRGRGGAVEGLLVSNVLMDGVMCPFVLNMYYFCGKGGKERRVWDKTPYPVDAGTPAIRDVRIHQVTATGATACAGFLYGLAERPIERVSLVDVTVSMQTGRADNPAMLDGMEPMEARGFFLRNARDVTFERVQVVGAVGDRVDADESVTWR